MLIDPRKIGGSSAASCLGVGWESQTALWSRLRGDESSCRQWTREEQRRLDAGHALEPIVCRAVREDYGVEILPAGDELVLDGEPRIVGHVDGWIVKGRVGSEIKTVGHRGPEWGDLDTDQVPAPYLVQCMHYMALSGAEEWHLFAERVPSWRVDRYIVRRDEDMIAHMLASERRMLRLVDAGTPPDPADEAEARTRWFAHTPGTKVTADADVMAALTRRAIAGAAIRVLEKVRSDCALAILQHATDAEQIVTDLGSGEVGIAALKANRVFDAGEFQSRYPDLAAQCLAFDKAKAREFRKEYEACMREAAGPGESTRQIRTTKAFKAALKAMLSGQAIALPHIPEIAEIAQGDHDG